MKKSETSASSLFTTVLMAVALTLGLAGPAAAQTADNVICNGCINSRDIQNGQVKRGDLGENAVGKKQIGKGAVGSSEVKTNSIPATDLSNEGGADFAGGAQTFVLVGGAEVIRSVSITAPSDGVVVVSASGEVNLISNALDRVVCSISTGVGIDSSHDTVLDDFRVEASEASMAYAATRGFNVSAGSTTFNLVCQEILGDIVVRDTSMTAMFFPTQY